MLGKHLRPGGLPGEPLEPWGTGQQDTTDIVDGGVEVAGTGGDDGG